MYNNCRSRKPKKGGILSIIAFWGGICISQRTLSTVHNFLLLWVSEEFCSLILKLNLILMFFTR